MTTRPTRLHALTAALGEALAPSTPFDWSRPTMWSSVGMAVAGITGPTGALVLNQRDSLDLLAGAGVLGGGIIGSAACLLHAFVPPPGDTAVIARNFVFTITAATLGPALGLAICGRPAGVDGWTACIYGLAGIGVPGSVGSVLFIMGHIVRHMFVEEPF